MLVKFMPSKKPAPFHILFADVTLQDMTLSGHQEAPDTPSHLSVQFVGIVKDGVFKGQDLELQISRDLNYDVTKKYAGTLFQSKPCLMFGVSTDTERFAHLVTLIATKAIKELYLCFEPPKYGKAKVISWHVSTELEPEV